MKKTFLFSFFLIIIVDVSFAQVSTYDIPGGEQFKSADYEVSVIQNGDTLKSFVLYSFGMDTIYRYSWNLNVVDTVIKDHKGPASHSSSIFSFSGEVKVRVKVLEGASHITLPLQSAKILPSSYNIPCEVINGNIIEFTLDRPEKVVVLPNYDQAWDVYAQKGIGHVPIESWRNNYQTERNRDTYHGTNLDSYLSEGYNNPLFVFAHGPEKRIPDSTSVNTLVVRPGEYLSQDKISSYKTVWFTPGVYDLSDWGTMPWYQTKVRKGQTIYLEGGAYVKARFKEDIYGDGLSSIVGRGVISGIDHKWVRSFAEGSQVISIDTLSGVTITDRACFGIYGGSYIGDIAMIGAWHGNTDGPDYTDNTLIENCFLQAHDDNLKINHNTHARHCVIWQGTNAHSIMVKETFRDDDGINLFANSVVEDIDIIAYFPNTDWDNPWPQISRAAISIVTAMDIEIRNFTFRDIRIESPYLSRFMNVYNLNTNIINPGWFNTTSDTYHTRIDGVTFSNITVNSPVIGYQSLIGSGYDNAIKNIQLSNIIINGTEITNENIDDYFEFECDRLQNVTINDSIACVVDTTAAYIPVYGVSISNCPMTILQTGDTYQLNGGVAPANASDTSVIWSSSDPSVLRVDETGLITAISQGSATVSIQSNEGGFQKSCSVGVMSTGIPLSGININGCPENEIEIDEKIQLGVAYTPANAGDLRVSWTSSNDEVATVDHYGIVTSVDNGSAIISATSIEGGFTDSCSLVIGSINTHNGSSQNLKSVQIIPNSDFSQLQVIFDDIRGDKIIHIYGLYGELLVAEYGKEQRFDIDIHKFGSESILIVRIILDRVIESFKILNQKLVY